MGGASVGSLMANRRDWTPRSVACEKEQVASFLLSWFDGMPEVSFKPQMLTHIVCSSLLRSNCPRGFGAEDLPSSLRPSPCLHFKTNS